MDSVGSSGTPHEIDDITRLMKPHLQLRRLYSTYYGKSHPSAQFVPTLLCLFLKAGYLHILSFASLGTCESSSAPTAQLVDSLPFALQCENEDSPLDRMRIAMALFTLQRHVAKICSEWDDKCWPREMFADEHECIVDVTGVATPSPSAYVDHNDRSWWHDLAWLSNEDASESNDTEFHKGSSDASSQEEPSDDEKSRGETNNNQDHDKLCEDRTNTGKTSKGDENSDALAQGNTDEPQDPDYEEDLNYSEDS